jgi:hypothetical protein
MAPASAPIEESRHGASEARRVARRAREPEAAATGPEHATPPASTRKVRCGILRARRVLRGGQHRAIAPSKGVAKPRSVIPPKQSVVILKEAPSGASAGSHLAPTEESRHGASEARRVAGRAPNLRPRRPVQSTPRRQRPRGKFGAGSFGRTKSSVEKGAVLCSSVQSVCKRPFVLALRPSLSS